MLVLEIIGLILFAIVTAVILLFSIAFEIACWYRESPYYTGWEDKDHGNN